MDQAPARRGLLQADRPFRVGTWPFYYGWFLLPVVALGSLMSMPGQTAGVGPFVEHLMRATGLTRDQLTWTYLVGTVLSGCCIPWAGRVLDRIGSRAMVMLACLGLAGTMCFMAVSDRLGAALGGGSATLAVLCVGFFLLRFCGQGMLTLAASTTPPRWFRRRRGLATGIVQVCLALANSCAPLVFHALIVAQTWRGAWLVLALIVGVGMVLTAWLFWRDTPEQCGLPIDGLAAEAARTRARDPLPTVERHWTRHEALRTGAFWFAMLLPNLFGFLITAESFHIIDFGAGYGLDETGALFFFQPFFWTMLPVGILGNLLADRLSHRVFLPLMGLGMALHALCLALIDGAIGFYMSAAVLGAAAGLLAPVNVTTLPRWFGRTHLGAIDGVKWACIVVGSALGPTSFALIRGDGSSGSYLPAVLACGVLALLIGLGGAFLRDPRPSGV